MVLEMRGGGMTKGRMVIAYDTDRKGEEGRGVREGRQNNGAKHIKEGRGGELRM